MEQHLETAYLRPGPLERAAALGLGAAGIGFGILLAAWGISFLWRFTPPEVRIANPELTVSQSGPFVVKQNEPFTIQQPGPLKIDPAGITLKTEQPLPAGSTKGASGETKTSTGDMIKHEVTVFWMVNHMQGDVVTGWTYPNGRGGVPVREYCYYTSPNLDGSSKKVDIAFERIEVPVIALVPDLKGAVAKCQWSQRGGS